MASTALLARTLFAFRSLCSRPGACTTSGMGLRSLSRYGASQSYSSYSTLKTFQTLWQPPSLVRFAAGVVRSITTSSTAPAVVWTEEPVVSVDWLHANIKEPDIKVLDASWYMPNEQRNPLQEFQVLKSEILP